MKNKKFWTELIRFAITVLSALLARHCWLAELRHDIEKTGELLELEQGRSDSFNDNTQNGT